MAQFNKYQAFLDMNKLMARFPQPLNELTQLEYLEAVTLFFQALHDKGFETGFQAALDSEEALKKQSKAE